MINHGSTQNELQRAGYRLPEYSALTEWLVAHGYAVAVPQRPGHGKTGGTYYEDQGGCANADFRKAGLNTAASIAAAIDYLSYQPFIRKKGRDRHRPVGRRLGARLALASQHYPPLKAVVAFAPGRGGTHRRRSRQELRAGPIDRRGAAVRREDDAIPSLWLYAENDSYFRPELSKRLVDAYRLAGGRAEYHLLPPVGDDGHDLIRAREGVALWAPLAGEKVFEGANDGAGVARRQTASASLLRSLRLRSFGSSSFLRSRIDFGVTSTSSSSSI